jgi:hypothetical protein
MFSWQRIRRWSALSVVALLLTTGLAVGGGTDAGAVSIPTFSFAPISAPGSAPRTSFHYDALPGQTINDSVVLTNQTSQPEDFQIWASDGYNTKVGGAFALRPVGYPMTGVGTWVNTHLGTAVYGLAGNESVTLRFSVTVPANATPGFHAGGIEALNVTPVAQPTSGPAHFVVHRGIGTAMFVQVAGPVHAAAAVSDISVKSSVPAIGFGSRTADVSFQLENTGNTLLSGFAVVTVTDLFGRTVKTFAPVGVQVFVPGARFTVQEPTWKNLPLIGPETVHVTFTSSGMRKATGESTFWIFPWLLVLLILLFLGLVIWRVIVWRRKRAGITDRPDDGSGPDHGGSTIGEGPEGAEVEPEPSVARAP